MPAKKVAPKLKEQPLFKHKSFSHKDDCCKHIKHVECKINQILDIVSCGDPIHITQEMVSEGFTITESGAYKLCSDIVFTPAANGENAITVDVGVTNVNIDFGNYTLSMNPSSQAADNNGILIQSNCENIVIHGGTITGFSASSIRGYTGLNTIIVNDMILEGIPSGNRLINETVVSGVNLGAIVQNTASNSPVETPPSYNISLNNLIIRGFLLNNLTIAEQCAWGVSLWYCNDILLNHVDVSQITMSGLVQNSLTTAQGFAFQFCTNSISRFCSSKAIVSLSPNFNGLVVGDAVGSVYLKCARCENYDCSYANNLGTRRSGGLVFVGTNDFVAERCTAD
ncbi:MAG: hypothetical protein LLF94_01030, partial [Chlamydiales bacterium]|nr:hypothetical protein [Chlamydiales bacterium]